MIACARKILRSNVIVMKRLTQKYLTFCSVKNSVVVYIPIAAWRCPIDDISQASSSIKSFEREHSSADELDSNHVSCKPVDIPSTPLLANRGHLNGEI
jgi:hypothetical protein